MDYTNEYFENLMSFNVNEQLGYNVNRVAILLRRELTKCFREYNMTPEQWIVLANLWRKDSISQTQIASITAQDLPAVSRMIKRMVTNGLVTKERDSKSERTTIIKLTSKGRKLEKILPNKLEVHFHDIWQKFPEKKRTMLQKLLFDFRIILGDTVE